MAGISPTNPSSQQSLLALISQAATRAAAMPPLPAERQSEQKTSGKPTTAQNQQSYPAGKPLQRRATVQEQAAVAYQRQTEITPFVEQQKPANEASKAGQSKPAAPPTTNNPLSPAEQYDQQQDEETLSIDEKLRIKELKQADKAIHAHEQAHMIAAGAFAQSGAVFEYQKGPDGKNYAVHGEVAIDTAKELDPRDTIEKMRIVRSAATAPADPSPADLKIAANASSKIIEAKQEMRLDMLRKAEVAYRKSQQTLKKAEASQEEVSKKLFAEQTKAGKEESTGPEIAESENNAPPSHYAINTAAKRMVTLASYQYFGLDIMV